MKPEAVTIGQAGATGIEMLLNRLQTVKKAEFLVGRHLLREDAVKLSTDEFLAFAEETFNQLLPIYDCVIHKD